MQSKKTIISDLWVIIPLIFFLVIFIALKNHENNNLYKILVFCGSSNKTGKLFLTSITTQFVHLDMLHLLSNSIFITYLVKQTSIYNSQKKNIILALLSLLFVSLCFVLFAKDNVAYVGASGWISGILGSFLVVSLKTSGFKITNKNISVFCLCAVFIAQSFIVPSTSIIAHVGGFIFGVIFELVFSLKFNSIEKK